MHKFKGLSVSYHHQYHVLFITQIFEVNKCVPVLFRVLIGVQKNEIRPIHLFAEVSYGICGVLHNKVCSLKRILNCVYKKRLIIPYK